MNLEQLADCFRADKLSSFQKLRFAVRHRQNALINRIVLYHGKTDLSEIKTRTIFEWYSFWSNDGKKVANGHSLIKQLRVLFGYGLTLLEDQQCQRLRVILSTLKFPKGKRREQKLNIDQVNKIRCAAHLIGLHSIAFAQALQFELMLRQKDIIGEWIPVNEPDGISEITHDGLKWLRGLRRSEIDCNLILRHVTSKKEKEIEVNLTLSPLIVQELPYIRFDQDALIICERTNRPWKDFDFRTEWRKLANDCGVPKAVYNMDSRAGAISEAFIAGANPDFIRASATHSDLAMTQNYNRGFQLEKSSDVMVKRINSRI